MTDGVSTRYFYFLQGEPTVRPFPSLGRSVSAVADTRVDLSADRETVEVLIETGYLRFRVHSFEVRTHPGDR